jgi:hypothetical protein
MRDLTYDGPSGLLGFGYRFEYGRLAGSAPTFNRCPLTLGRARTDRRTSERGMAAQDRTAEVQSPASSATEPNSRGFVRFRSLDAGQKSKPSNTLPVQGQA